MINLYNEFVLSAGAFLNPIEVYLSHLPFSMLAVLTMSIAFISLYAAVIDKYVWEYSRITILRRSARFLIVLFFILGLFNMLIVFLLIYYVTLMILEIKETAHNRFSREIK